MNQLLHLIAVLFVILFTKAGFALDCQTASASGHEFVGQYLDGNVSGPKITNDLKDVISRVSSNVSVPASAAIEYLNESLSPFLQYACKLQATKSKLTDGE